jgi:hypothetical protein
VLEAMGRGWFVDGVERQVGSGVETLFWSDLWLGGVPLSVRYPRLFDLSLHRLSSRFDLKYYYTFLIKIFIYNIMQISQRRNELKQDITNNFIYNFHESNIKI